MSEVLAFVLVAITSAATYIVINKTAAPRRPLFDVVRALMECIGAFVAFFAINVGLGAAIILLTRALTQRFVALYVLESVMLAILSAFQGFLFHLWWRRG